MELAFQLFGFQSGGFPGIEGRNHTDTPPSEGIPGTRFVEAGKRKYRPKWFRYPAVAQKKRP